MEVKALWSLDSTCREYFTIIQSEQTSLGGYSYRLSVLSLFDLSHAKFVCGLPASRHPVLTLKCLETWLVIPSSTTPRKTSMFKHSIFRVQAWGTLQTISYQSIYSIINPDTAYLHLVQLIIQTLRCEVHVIASLCITIRAAATMRLITLTTSGAGWRVGCVENSSVVLDSDHRLINFNDKTRSFECTKL